MSVQSYYVPHLSTNQNDSGYFWSAANPATFSRTSLGKIKSSLPNWRDVIRSRGDATTAYQTWSQFCRFTPVDNHVRYSYDDAGVRRFGDCNIFTSPSARYSAGDYVGPSQPSLSDHSSAKLNVDFLSRVKAAQIKFEGGTFVGELRSTLHGLLNPAKAIQTYLFSYLSSAKKRGRGLKKAKDIKRMVRDTYLEYQFHWKPLINDVASAGKALNSLGGRNIPVKVSATVGERLVPIHSPFVYTTIPSWFRFNCLLTEQYDLSSRLYGIVNNSSSPPSFSESLGLTPRNFVPTVWNLIPFSFVADYFLNIGNCLDAMSVLGASFITCGKSTKIRGKSTYTFVPDLSYTTNTFTSGAPTNLRPESIICPTSSTSYPYSGFWRIAVSPSTISIRPTFSIPGFGSDKWLKLSALADALTDTSRSLTR